jgi:Rrf2 family protein
LARHADANPLRANDLAEAVNVPQNYLGKILHELARAGILNSTRGKHGGFELAIPPEELSLLDVVSRFDKLGDSRRCLMGRPECNDKDPCPVHGQWKETAEQISAFFRDTTVADVLN